MMLKTSALIISVLRNPTIDKPATATKKWLKNRRQSLVCTQPVKLNETEGIVRNTV